MKRFIYEAVVEAETEADALDMLMSDTDFYIKLMDTEDVDAA